jgi:hypothetical protein
MWHLGERHNPMSLRYAEYWDNRPILPQDSTRFLGKRRLADPDPIKYYFNKKTKKYLISNNIPVEERMKLKTFENYYFKLIKNINILSLVPAIYFTGVVTKCFKGHLDKKKFVVPILLLYFYSVSKVSLTYPVRSSASLFYDYIMKKYDHLAKENLNDIEDPRRKFFRPDTTTYYRETPQEIFESKSHAQLHDSSIYYGPHPFNDHENVDEVMEINKKFMEGHCSIDNNELLLGDPIDVKRSIRSVATFDEYKKF